MSALTALQTAYGYASSAAEKVKAAAQKIAPAMKTAVKASLVVLAAAAIAWQGGSRTQEAASTQLVPAVPPRANPDFTPAADPRYPRTEENHLAFEYRFMASQDYIDNVQPSDLKEPVMWGIDARGRAFWSARVVCHKADGTTSKGAITWFQRYTGEGQLVYGSHHMPQGCSSPGNLDPVYHSREFPDAMRRLLRGERVHAHIDRLGYGDDIHYDFQLDRN